MGLTRFDRGEIEDSLQNYQQAIELLQPLAEEFPTEPSHRADLASNYNNLGVSQKALGRLDEARKALNNGEIVGVFPEGGVTRSGPMQAFRPGVLRVLDGTDVPVIPAYLDELWGSIFSFHGGRFLWKWPQKWPYPLLVYSPRFVRPPR